MSLRAGAAHRGGACWLSGLAAVIALGLVVVPGAAYADLTMPDVSDERGIGVGSFHIWPRLDLQGGYDSNVFFQAENDVFLPDSAFDSPVGAPMLRVAPGLRIENPNYGDIRLIFDGEGNYRQFFSGETAIDEGQSSFGATVNFSVGFFEKRDASIKVFDQFIHRLDTPNFSTSQTFNRLVNDSGLRVALHPGGVGARKALEVGAEYSYELERFIDFDSFNTDTHNTRLYGTWRFFPKTALELEAKFSIRQWAIENNGQGRTNSMPLRVTAGINGFITKRIATVLKVGYAQGFYDFGPELQTVIGQATVTYSPLSTTVLSVGYMRDFVDSLYGNYYIYDRFYLDAKQRFFNRLSVQATASFQLLGYAPYDPSAAGVQDGFIRYSNMSDRNEKALEVKTSITYDFARYIGLIVSYEYRQLFSDFEMETEYVAARDGDFSTTGERKIIDRGGYARHLILAGVTLRY